MLQSNLPAGGPGAASGAGNFIGDGDGRGSEHYRMEQKPASGPNPAPTLANIDPGTAVGDLQALDRTMMCLPDSDPDTDGTLLDDCRCSRM